MYKYKRLVALLTMVNLMLYMSPSEALYQIKGSPSGKFIDMIREKTNDPDNVFYKAMITDAFMAKDDWYIGVIGNQNDFYLSLLLSDNSEDAVILSGRCMIRRDNSLNSSQSYHIALTKERDIYTNIFIITEALGNRGRPWYPLDMFEYCSSDYLVHCYIFNATYENLEGFENYPLVGRNGNNIQQINYYCKDKIVSFEHPNGILKKLNHEFQETDLPLYRYYPSLESIPEEIRESYATRKNYYQITLNSGIIVKLMCDAETNGVNLVEVLSHEKMNEELFRAYLDVFFLLTESGFSKFSDYLILLYGENFDWHNYLTTNVKYGVNIIQVKSFILDDWKIEFGYSIDAFPVMSFKRIEYPIKSYCFYP